MMKRKQGLFWTSTSGVTYSHCQVRDNWRLDNPVHVTNQDEIEGGRLLKEKHTHLFGSLRPWFDFWAVAVYWDLRCL